MSVQELAVNPTAVPHSVKETRPDFIDRRMEWKNISGMEWNKEWKRKILEWNGNGMEKNSLHGNGNVTVGFHSFPVPVKKWVC